MKLTFEISIDSVRSALNAQSAGADRVELCASLIEGGITPSIGMIKTVKEKTGLDMYVIIRPRGGDFLYTDEEFEVMRKDIISAKENGADGIVSGALLANGDIDIDKTREMIKLSEPLPFTFHRAFDMCRDPFMALEQLKELKAARILTSGQMPTAEKGANLLAELVKRANDDIVIMPGAGINDNNIEYLIKKTNAREYHFSAKKSYPSKMKYFNKNINMGRTKNKDEYSVMYSDEGIIKTLIDKANSFYTTKRRL
ncbi:MAG: copper homeostasis protein CutC [Chlorobi bacterium]|nr:copper homeostasis protein CutC [Chlorobiota bacterium]